LFLYLLGRGVIAVSFEIRAWAEINFIDERILVKNFNIVSYFFVVLYLLTRLMFLTDLVFQNRNSLLDNGFMLEKDI